MSINATTGLISGTTSGPGTYRAQVFIRNAGGTATFQVDFVVGAYIYAPYFPYQTFASSAQVGSFYTYQINAGGPSTLYSADPLPAGLQLDPGPGEISGIPLEAGRFSLTIGASNVLGSVTHALDLFVSLNSTLTTVHTFAMPEGIVPSHGLVEGIDGYLYGTTHNGGANNYGTLFKLTRGGDYQVLHHFSIEEGSGGPLMRAADGSLYGVLLGNADRLNTIYRLNADGSLAVIKQFHYFNGDRPAVSLVPVPGGLYGTTSAGGASNRGTSSARVREPAPSVRRSRVPTAASTAPPTTATIPPPRGSSSAWLPVTSSACCTSSSPAKATTCTRWPRVKTERSTVAPISAASSALPPMGRTRSWLVPLSTSLIASLPFRTPCSPPATGGSTSSPACPAREAKGMA